MRSEFLHGALPVYRRAAGATVGRPEPLDRARELSAELLLLVTRTRTRVAELQAERDQLRRELALALKSARVAREQALPLVPPVDEPDRSKEPERAVKAGRGDMRRALEPVLAGRGREHRPSLVALLGGERESG